MDQKYIYPMKKFIFIVFLLAGAIQQSIYAQTIEIKEGNLKINENPIEFPWTFNDFTGKNGLGKFNRNDLGGANDIFTYDKTGIILYRPPASDKISDFNMYYGKDPDSKYKFIPKKYFKGKFIVDGFTIASNTSLAEVQKALPQYEFEKTSIEAYRGSLYGLYIYLRYDDAEKNISWISVGKRE
jgi:hypothetical protein